MRPSLDMLRFAQERLLRDTCVLKTRSLTSDGRGGSVESWTDGASVACRVAPMTAEQTARVADQLASASGWVVTMPYGTSVGLGDRIVHNGFTYDVVGTNDGESEQTAVRAYCGRVR